MATSILVLIGMLVDVGLGAAAYKHAHKVESMVKKVDERVERLENKA